MMPERVIRVEEVAGSWHYTVPLRIPLCPSIPMRSIVILNQGGWNNILPLEDNEVVYGAVQAMNAMNGVRVIDLRHLEDGTSCFNILVATSAPENVHDTIVSILRDFFMLQDCLVERLPLA